MALKYEYFVAIVNADGSYSYVTKVDNSTHTFYCEQGKPAMRFAKSVAESLHLGMVANLCPSVIIKSAKGCLNLSNSGEGKTEERTV